MPDYVDLETQEMLKGIARVGLDKSESLRKQSTFSDNEQFKTFVRRAIYKKSPLVRHKLLNLLFNYGKKLADLEAILPEVIGETEILRDGKVIKGMIWVSGDGVKGTLGDGPITYHWKELK